jgi:hypothetical protein
MCLLPLLLPVYRALTPSVTTPMWPLTSSAVRGTASTVSSPLTGGWLSGCAQDNALASFTCLPETRLLHFLPIRYFGCASCQHRHLPDVTTACRSISPTTCPLVASPATSNALCSSPVCFHCIPPPCHPIAGMRMSLRMMRGHSGRQLPTSPSVWPLRLTRRRSR